MEVYFISTLVLIIFSAGGIYFKINSTANKVDRYDSEGIKYREGVQEELLTHREELEDKIKVIVGEAEKDRTEIKGHLENLIATNDGKTSQRFHSIESQLLGISRDLNQLIGFMKTKP